MKKERSFLSTASGGKEGGKEKVMKKHILKYFNYLIIINFHPHFYNALQCQIKGIFSGKWH